MNMEGQLSDVCRLVGVFMAYMGYYYRWGGIEEGWQVILECWAGCWNTGTLERWNWNWNTGTTDDDHGGGVAGTLEHWNWSWNAGTVNGIVGGEGLEHWNTGTGTGHLG